MAGPKRLSTRRCARQGTHPGIRLWTVKQAPFLQPEKYTWDFDFGDITFTPKMDKRSAPGPFTGAPIIQGKFDGSGVPDHVRWSRGSQIDNDFYSHLDAYQGSISFWWTPEIAYSGSNITEYIYYAHHIQIYYRHQTGRLTVAVGGSGMSGVVSSVAGSLYHVVLRWDIDNTLDGTNHVCVSINDSHSFGIPTAYVASSISTHDIGCLQGTSNPANAILEAFTIWRRPLWDGTYGINVNGVDEINAMWAAGAGKDPCEITGSWDVCFCLPTKGTGEIVTGEGEAWSHPHGSNLLGVGGFMMDGTYSNDGWVYEGTPVSIAACATAHKIFAGGYQIVSNAANEGFYKDYTCSAGDDFVIRAIGHSDGTSIPKAILYDQTNTAEIGNLVGSSGSTRTAPDVFIFTGEAPAGCTTLRVKLINTDATADDVTYWHQCELLENLITNPSLQGGAGDPWLPTGWTSDYLSVGDSTQETTTVHSGTDSLAFTATADNQGIQQVKTGVMTIGKYVAQGFWVYGDGSNDLKIFDEYTGRIRQHNGADNQQLVTPSAAWNHYNIVGRMIDDTTHFRIRNMGGVTYIDDAYLFELDDISLTITPASEANSQEHGGIQIGGRDRCISSLSGVLSKTRGKVSFNIYFRHDAADCMKFKTGSYPYIFQCQGSGANYFYLRWTTANTMQLLFNDGGGNHSDNWPASGEIVADTEYLFEIEYIPNRFVLRVDGVEKAVITEPVDFASIPYQFYAGANSNYAYQADVVILTP